MATDKLSKGELKFLKELNKENVKYIIIGLSAAALQGAPVVTQNIDIWFESITDPAIKKALKKVKGVMVPTVGLNPPALAGENVKLFDIVLNVHGIDSFSKEYKRALKIRIGDVEVAVLPLERIIKSKEFLNRHKDLLVLPVLRDVAAVLKNESKK